MTTNPLSLQSRDSSLFKDPSGEKSQFLMKTFLGALFMIALGCVVALLSLYQWGSPQPWSSLDIFSGGVILFGLIWAFGHDAISSRNFSFARGIARGGGRNLRLADVSVDRYFRGSGVERFFRLRPLAPCSAACGKPFSRSSDSRSIV